MDMIFGKKHYQHLNIIRISKSALLSNYQAIQSVHPEAKVCPVIKSNAYGHGLTQVAPILDTVHAPFFCVDSLYEAYELMKLRTKTPIFIMGYTKPENYSVKRLPFEFSVFDKETVEALSLNQPGSNVHIKIDSGMSRYGLRLADTRSFVRFAKTKNVNIVGLWSHFADADNPKSNKMVDSQIAVYKEALKVVRSEGIEPIWRHISASAGSYKVFDTTFNMIRSGIAIYGISPLSETDTAQKKIILKPVGSLRSTVTQIKTLKPGDMVGYNATYSVKRQMNIAILPLGYFEGVDRRLSGCGVVIVNGEICPIVGRVSMNITAIDISKTKNVSVGDTCIVYSNDLKSEASVAHQAEKARTIPYDILVHLNSSIHRELTD
jgi:alanine racemase